YRPHLGQRYRCPACPRRFYVASNYGNRHFFGSFCRLIRLAYWVHFILRRPGTGFRPREILTMKISNILKFAALSAALMVGACTTKQEVAATPPPPVAPQAQPAPMQAPGIVPGSVQDFKVNVGDTVH